MQSGTELIICSVQLGSSLNSNWNARVQFPLGRPNCLHTLTDEHLGVSN